MKFEVGQSYQCRSVCDWDCVWTFRVVSRTAKFITIVQDNDPHEKPKRVGVREYKGIEAASPLGTYSMAPVISAGRAIS